MERPDLTGLPAAVLAYIESLENQLHHSLYDRAEAQDEATFEPSEPPTSAHLITVSAAGLAKRTPRHLYNRQRRGGMGIFDLDSPEKDPPAFLAMATPAEMLTLLTSHGRVFRVPVAEISERPVRSRGEPLNTRLPLRPEERLALVLPGPPENGAFLVLVTERGQDGKGTVRLLAGLTANKAPGSGGKTAMKADSLVGVAAVTEESDLFVLSRLGKLIRFRANEVPPKEGVVQGVHCMSLRADECIALLALAP